MMVVRKGERKEYGDFQTSLSLAMRITEQLAADGIDPEIIIEPTCGTGAFLVAALRTFKNIRKIVAVEIHDPYVKQARQNVDRFLLENPLVPAPAITIAHTNFFDFDFAAIASLRAAQRLLILGNPPWVTNSELSVLESANLPPKSNFKNHNGLDAITGKGNFDIAESITTRMLEVFQNVQGHLALLIKDSVIRNILFNQRQRNLRAIDWKAFAIDTKKEFNASVHASLLTMKLNHQGKHECGRYELGTGMSGRHFGWTNDKFVSDIESYTDTTDIDGDCPLEWRQGVKHDCSSIMEFEIADGGYTNGLSEKLMVEEEMVYGILKSSDLKQPVIAKTRKYTLITQTRIGQDTTYIKDDFPNAFDYLQKHQARLDARKSVIYKKKPLFSIFGIGDYSFMPYKVTISGLYKSFVFNLVLPQNGKPVMLDDTCYFIGFDNLFHAVFTVTLLNSVAVGAFLRAITFPDAKRTFTKEVLMRIDLLKVAQSTGFEEADKFFADLPIEFAGRPTLSDWNDYLTLLARAGGVLL